MTNNTWKFRSGPVIGRINYYAVWYCLLLILGAVAADAQTAANKEEEQWRSDLVVFKDERLKNLHSLASPLNVVGVIPLREGINAFGSDKSNAVVIPSANVPAHAGKYIIKGDSVTVALDAENGVRSLGRSGLRIAEIPYPEPQALPADSNIILAAGSFNWILQFAEGKAVVRIRDQESESQKKFSALEYYPVNNKWRIRGKYKAHKSPTSIDLKTVFGTISTRKAAGTVSFIVDDKEYVLEAVDRGSQLFFTFSDKSADIGSYAFRFLFIPKPKKEEEEVWLDFNRSTNPNCVFSAYTACPLPPSQNILPLNIDAGEKKYEPLR